ncbi:MAG: ABC transporter permease [Verrucomicrobia bacterium]|nr:ABC transporter permease [Verrucomicrobiota bacterium]
MPWFLYLALKQLFPTGRKFPFFTAISMLGVALGVAVLVIVTSVMGGFGYEIRRMIVQTEGEVQVKGRGLIEDVGGLLATVRGTPGVAGATPYVEGPVGILAANRPAFPLMKGIDVSSVGTVANLSRFVRRGSLDDLDDDSVILSWETAQQLGASVGSRIAIYSPLLFEKLNQDEVFLPRQFRVAGWFEIGHQHLDNSLVFCTLRTAQDLYGLGQSVHGLNVRLQPGVDEITGATRLNQVLPNGVAALPWTQKWESFLWVLNLEKTINFFLLLFIVIIAAFSVMSSLLISVVRKTREIGLLGALGASRRDVALCFCAQAFIIGTAGTAVGLGLGFTALAFRKEIVRGIASALQRQDTLRQFYQFTELPSHTLMSDLILTVVMAIVISTLAGLLPAWRAARLKPVEALRSE